MSSAIRVAGIFLISPVLFATAPATAPAPAAAPPAAVGPLTKHDVYRQLLAFNRRTTVEAYRKVGERDPKWDAAAEQFLDGMSRHFAAAHMEVHYIPADFPSRDQLIEEGRKVVARGCDDPLVLYCLSAMLHDNGHLPEATPLLRRAYEGLKDGRYGDYRAFAAANRWIRVTEDPAEREQAHTLCHDRAVTMCCGKLEPIERRKMLEAAWEIQATRESQQVFVTTLRGRPDADPWIRETAAGYLHIKLAWESRGSGFANTVTPEGWRGFFENLKVARDHLTRAWKMAPEHPEAATEMITVAMGGGAELGEKVRVWFERALAAQVDYDDAYSTVLNALLPRWGGSYEQMHEVGLACLENPRFDTDVPWQYLEVLDRIGRDSGDRWAMLADPQVYANVVKVLQGYAKARGPGPNRGDWYETQHAAAAWRSGRHDEARQVLDALARRKAEPQVRAFGWFTDGDPAEALSEVYARTGPDAAALDTVDRLAEDGDARAAVRTLRALAGKLPKDDPAARYLAGRLRVLEWPLKFAEGEWVPIQPPPGLRGWRVREGQWKVEADGALTGSNTQKAPKQVNWEAGQVGRDFEVAGTVEFLPTPGNVRGGFGGIVIASTTARHRGFILLDPHTQKAAFLFGPDKTHVYDVPLKEAADFLVRSVDGTLSLEVNGKAVGAPLPVPEQYGDALELGVGGVDPHPVRLKNLKLRKLKPPANRAAAP